MFGAGCLMVGAGILITGKISVDYRSTNSSTSGCTTTKVDTKRKVFDETNALLSEIVKLLCKRYFLHSLISNNYL